jgi:plastocyanin domain-containing protein
MITLLINLLGLVLIMLIIWWFWLSKNPKAMTEASDEVTIYVQDGVYQPDLIKVKANQPITLRFIRKDPQPCAEIVVFNTLAISKVLPLNKPVDINIRPQQPGEFEFTCQMGMYRGKIICSL